MPNWTRTLESRGLHSDGVPTVLPGDILTGLIPGESKSSITRLQRQQTSAPQDGRSSLQRNERVNPAAVFEVTSHCFSIFKDKSNSWDRDYRESGVQSTFT